MESTINRALASMRRETGMKVAFGGAIGLHADSLTITQTTGTSTRALDELLIRRGHGVGGKVLADGRIAAVADYLTDRRITHLYDAAVAAEKLRCIVGAPVIIDGRVRAVLYGGTHIPVQLGSAVMAAIDDIARRAAFEIAVAEATDRRVRAVETATLMRTLRSGPTDAEWEAVRGAYAELRALTQTVDDPFLRARLDGITAQLAGESKRPDAVPLSPRETDVLALVGIGCSNQEIAERLNLERETVKSYLRSAMRKFSVHTRTEAVFVARASGQLP